MLTLKEAQALVEIFNDPHDTLPYEKMVCTCFMCVRDYAQRFASVFPQFCWRMVPIPEEPDFGMLEVTPIEKMEQNTHE